VIKGKIKIRGFRGLGTERKVQNSAEGLRGTRSAASLKGKTTKRAQGEGELGKAAVNKGRRAGKRSTLISRGTISFTGYKAKVPSAGSIRVQPARKTTE